MVFHLTAQALVHRAYDDPTGPFETNNMGTLNVLQCLRYSSLAQAAVIITSDKCYRNVERPWGYWEWCGNSASTPNQCRCQEV